MRKRFPLSIYKKTLLNRLLKNYALILASLILVGMVSIGMNTYWQAMGRGKATTQEAVDLLSRSINDKNLQGKTMLNGLTDNQDKINSLNRYMGSDIPEYLNYTYDEQLKTGNYLFLPSQVKNFYTTYENIESIIMVLNNYEGYYLSTNDNKGGMKEEGTPDLEDKFYLSYPMIHPVTLEVFGSFYVEFSKQDMLSSLMHLTTYDGLSAYIFSETGYQLLTYTEVTKQMDQELIQKRMKETSELPIQSLMEKNLLEHLETVGGFNILVTISKEKIVKAVLSDLRILVVGGGVLILILLYLLYRTFTKYSQQVDIIMDSMALVTQGDLNTRIDEKMTQFELKELSNGINTMLDNIEQYIADIYKLEIKQQDAHMRALQSQISPHFLYNTLEYIRMYALSEGSEELADVVYAFSTLLRNNTDQAKTTTLEKELSFCEKYVYLYQMRYPDRIAYHFEIDDALRGLVLPKFSIQPLIENYFVHGIDFSRNDNAISVKARVVGKRVEIMIRDNGKGISDQKLSVIQEKLKQQTIELHDSIGLQNVNERLRAYFSPTFLMQVVSNEPSGLTIILSFEKEQKDEL
ncbi:MULTISPECIES: sensor histidine kinase [unclassified Enterococcus]|uniref:sensor histidine kinase n=1 Tax=unclassified Enterococcus TaxID=2608891 RepID=UPI001CE1A446|nr:MULTISPECIES: sensor histidine kinase [unclassified Enterococcus]MCA5013754.1 sensor histidine kinase [Enterococcus sp. S23]MCA5017004.1 sensor histidine kinase [Enterococcus sp. S22(2020)]